MFEGPRRQFNCHPRILQQHTQSNMCCNWHLLGAHFKLIFLYFSDCYQQQQQRNNSSWLSRAADIVNYVGVVRPFLTCFCSIYLSSMLCCWSIKRQKIAKSVKIEGNSHPLTRFVRLHWFSVGFLKMLKMYTFIYFLFASLPSPMWTSQSAADHNFCYIETFIVEKTEWETEKLIFLSLAFQRFF